MNRLRDLLADLHARKLSIPAAALVVAIVAIAVALPKQPSEAPIASAPVNPGKTADAREVNVSPAAEIQFASDNPAIRDRILAFRSKNPFGKAVAAGATGATGGAGGGGTAPTGGTKPGGGGGGGGSDDTGKDIYLVDVAYDDKDYKKVAAGDGIPSDDSPIVLYAGPASSGAKANFLVADGLSVQGADVDADLGLITLEEGDEVVLSEPDGTTHRLSLERIRKQSG